MLSNRLPTLTVSILLVALGACGDDEPMSGPGGPTVTVRIGGVIDMSNNNADPGWIRGIRLAERHMNAALTADGSSLRFEVLLQDSENMPAIAVQRAVMLRDMGVKAIMLDSSQNTEAVHQTFYDSDPANDLNVPLQCSGCTSGSINNPTAMHMDPVVQAARQNGMKWLFRNLMNTRLITKVIVQLLLGRFGGNGDRNGDGRFKVVVLQSDESFGNATAMDAVTFATDLHGMANLVTERLKWPGTADQTHDWTGLIARALDSNTEGTDMAGMPTTTTDGAPDAVIGIGFAQQLVEVVRAYRANAMSADVPLLHVHTFRIQSTVEALSNAANGQEGVSHALVDATPSGTYFASQYEMANGEPPHYRDAIYYDNAMTLMLATLAAIRAVPGAELTPSVLTGAQVRDAFLTNLNAPAPAPVMGPDNLSGLVTAMTAGMAINYTGASGPLDWDANQNVKSRLAHYRVENGRFVDVAAFDCIASDDCPQL